MPRLNPSRGFSLLTTRLKEKTMKKYRILAGAAFALSILTLAATQPLFAQAAGPGSDVKTGIVILYARDPLAQSLCFRDGGYGSIFQENETRNRCSDLNFNGYKADAFTVGVEGSREGIIIDIGAAEDLQKRYGYDETVGKGQGFASLRVKEGKIYVLQNLRARTTQELKESDLLFKTPASENRSAAVKLGDIYLMRLTDKYEKGFELIVKLLVVAHVPNESVTLRWQIL